MIANGTPAGGVLQSFQRLTETGLGLLHNRAQLFAVELQEEKAHFARLLIAVAMLMLFGTLFGLVLTATIVMVCPESSRLYVAGGFGLLYLIGTIWAYARLRVRLQSPLPFSATINEVRKDREMLFQ